MRADAESNRQRLLNAAEQLFAAKGTSTGVAEIVAAAGVAPPTLYRHFGDKDGLIRAIAERRASLIGGNLAMALSQPTAWDGLRVALELSISMARNNRALRDDHGGMPLAPNLESMLLAGWEELVKRAHEEGSVRADFTGADVPFLAVAVVAVGLAAHDDRLQRRYVELIMESLRPDARQELPGPGPSYRDVTLAFARPDGLA